MKKESSKCEVVAVFAPLARGVCFLLLMAGLVMGQAEKTEKTKKTTTSGSIEYFLNIPGAKGTASRPGFEGWVEALTFSYRNLELPPPRDLMNAPPPVLRAIKTAKEIGRPICSFSKLQNDADT
ncbi:MAG: hypothetical protein GY940_44155, partial [bacterium]|nr:hypothetical protein [bacterium]